ncbi:MFS general substrate transporter, partial [Aureobasidium melanogenum]
MTANEKSSGVLATQSLDIQNDDGASKAIRKPTWYRSTFWNAFILGICNFLAPGIWGAMNSLGGGGRQSPTLVNTANALTFCLMVLTCFFSSVVVRWVGVKWALIIGTLGYCPYAAGLYVNNRYGDGWFVLLGAALCGLSAGIFWSVEAAIALAYPEPHNQGRFLGFWLSFRLSGQIVGGAINLGINVNNNKAGSVRTDGLPVRLSIGNSITHELKETSKLFFSKRFLLIVPLIAQAVYAESVFFTFQGLWFSVRARALGSFLSGIVAVIMGNVLGRYLDYAKFSLKSRSRGAFVTILGLQGAWWIWATVLVTDFNKTNPTYDWVDPGFGKGFALFLFWVAGFQLNYLFLYFVVGNLAASQEELIRICSLLRGTESAVQAVSYGLGSVTVMARTGNIYLNFGLWAISLLPAWLVVSKIGVTLGDNKMIREERVGDSLKEDLASVMI